MGSKKNWPEQLAKRCNAVGWHARIVSSGHYKVTTHDGYSFAFSVSPSGGNAYKNATRQANRYGLENLERQREQEHERRRLQRIADDRAAVQDITTTEEAKMTTPEHGSINGVPIIAVEPATIKTPRTGTQAALLKDAEAVLLENNKTLYRCTRQSIDNTLQICHKSFSSAQAVATHGSWHDRWQRAIDEASRKAAKAAKAPKSAQGKSIIGMDSEPGIVAKLAKLIEDAEALGDELGAVADTFDTFKGELHQLIQELPDHVTDAETREKVAEYEKMRELLSGFMQK